MTERRRPRARRGAPTGDRAGALFEAHLERRTQRAPNVGDMSLDLLLGGLRRRRPPFTVVALERSSGRLVAAEPVDGTEREAEAMLAAMQADLETLEPRAFLRKWRLRRI